MSRYRKKPVVIEAIQFNDNYMQFPGRCDCSDKGLPHIHTLEGIMIPDIKDWIIKGVKGEFYPCKPDIFKATYEKVD